MYRGFDKKKPPVSLKKQVASSLWVPDRFNLNN